jgi:3-hydroxyacyl-[acyl-carrier-protein] dehydratase
MILARTGFLAMPFLMSVDGAKMRDFVKPGANASGNLGNARA